jgi:2'-5' RNA ligase
VHEALEAIQNKLKTRILRARWTRPEGIHLTLKFLGDVSEERIPAVQSVIDDVVRKHRSFSITLRGVGAFPRLAAPRVLWVGLEPSDELSRIHRKLEGALEEIGFAAETRAFRGHLTLARLKGDRWDESLRRYFLDCNEISEGLTFHADRLVLFRSDLKPGGAVYSPLHVGCFERTSEKLN